MRNQFEVKFTLKCTKSIFLAAILNQIGGFIVLDYYITLVAILKRFLKIL